YRVKPYGLAAAFERGLLELATADIEPGKLSGALRDHGDAIVVLGQALQPRAGIHRIADGGNALRARRSHGADNGLAIVNANADPKRHGKLGVEVTVQFGEPSQHGLRAA